MEILILMVVLEYVLVRKVLLKVKKDYKDLIQSKVKLAGEFK